MWLFFLKFFFDTDTHMSYNISIIYIKSSGLLYLILEVLLLEYEKMHRILGIFFKVLKGEKISIKGMAQIYGVSTRTISRDINDIRIFLTENRELLNNAELIYSPKDKTYILNSDDFLLNKELFAVVKVILGSRCFNKEDLLIIIEKLKHFTTQDDREMFNEIIKKEVFHYHEVKSDCNGVIDNLWKIINCIHNQRVITIDYFKMNRSEVKHKIKPVSIMFSEYYFYLIAYKYNDESYKPIYFRIDRISHITENKEQFTLERKYDFNEGNLREKNQFMFPGKDIKIRFQFSGPSVQAILDRLPTAKIIERKCNGVYIIDAEVNNGRGIMMYLLSQGSWVKVLSPQSFIDDMRTEIESMRNIYND